MDKIPAEEPKDQPRKGSTRRAFLRNAAMFLGGAAVLDAATDAYQKRRMILRMLKGEAEENADESISQGKKFLKETYGMEVYFGDRWTFYNSSADPLNTKETSHALQMLIEELGKYPSDFFLRNKISEIRIGKNLRMGNVVNETLVGGYSHGRVRHISLRYEEGEEVLFRRALHHEIGHTLDFFQGTDTTQEKWDQIHNGCACTDPVSRKEYADGNPFRIENRAFINAYGEKNAYEERAEFAAMMMLPALHARFLKRLETENDVDRAALRRKYDAMKADFLKWSGGKMDYAYWHAVIMRGQLEPATDEVLWSSWGVDANSYGQQNVYSFEAVKEGVKNAIAQ